jgi:hypothetical protein
MEHLTSLEPVERRGTEQRGPTLAVSVMPQGDSDRITRCQSFCIT